MEFGVDIFIGFSLIMRKPPMWRPHASRPMPNASRETYKCYMSTGRHNEVNPPSNY